MSTKKAPYRGILFTLLYGNTGPVRFWIAILDIVYAFFLYKKADLNMLAIFPHEYANILWAALFTVNALFMLYGLFGNYCRLVFLLEGIMGWGLWTFTAIVNTIAEGVPGPLFVCALIMTWIIIRYPTQWKESAYG